MSKKNYDYKFHPHFFDILDETTKHLSDEEFSNFFALFEHELSILNKDPYSNSRNCKYGILHDKEFRTMTFHSQLPRSGTGDMRIIFEIDEESKLVLYWAVGRRINTRPRSKEDIYSKAEAMQ